VSYSITYKNLQLVQSYPPVSDEPYVGKNRKNCQEQSQPIDLQINIPSDDEGCKTGGNTRILGFWH